jgi:hypothetical protein
VVRKSFWFASRPSDAEHHPFLVFNLQDRLHFHLTSKRFFKTAFLLGGVALLMGMLLYFNLNRDTISTELAPLNIVPKPEKLTELYFSNNANLPSTAPGGRMIHFVFVIHNLEMADYQYRYKVSVNARGKRQIVDGGNVVVKNDQYYVKNEQFNLLNLLGSQEVVIELTNKQQSIDFWTGK